jgi:hypothetical protein
LGANAIDVTASYISCISIARGRTRRWKTHLVDPCSPQFERVGLPRAHPPVRSDTHDDGNARRARDRYFRERDRLNTASLLVARHLRQHGPLHEVDGSESSLCSSADGDGARRVDP